MRFSTTYLAVIFLVFVCAPAMASDAFLKAADSGDLKNVKKMVKSGIDVNYADSNGYTALMNASYGGHLSVVKFLIKSKANLDQTTPGKETAILLAAKKNHGDVYKYLLEHGADANIRSKSGATAKGVMEKRGVVKQDSGAVFVLPTTNPSTKYIPKGDWRYSEYSDPMGRGKIFQASVYSENRIELGFPYAGEQRGELTLRRHPEYGKDVILEIEKGQFNSGLYGGSVLVRFDDKPPIKFSYNSAADHSTNIIFIKGFNKFMQRIKKSDMVYIEAQFFQNGNRIFTFETAGLKWK